MPRKNFCSEITSTVKSKLTQISAAIYSAFGFVKTNKPWVLQAAACVAVVAYEANNTYESLIDQGSDINYAIARSCGASLKLLTLSTFFPLSRVLYTRIQNSRIGRYFGLDQRIVDHKIFATGILLFASIHTIAHYFHNPANFSKQPGITGIVMLGSFALPISGIFLLRKYATPCAIKSYGNTIIRTHQSGAACFLLAYLFHTSDLRLLKYAAISWSPLFIDRIVEKLFYKHVSNITQAFIIPKTDFISLHIKKPHQFRDYRPGQFALLSFPEINDMLEKSHPFTIVNVTDTEIEFLIKKIGPWTQKLYHWVNSMEGNNYIQLPVTLTGPLGKNILHECKDKPLAFIGTGVGMTPALAALNHLAKNNLNAHIELHISQKSLPEFIPCINILKKIPQPNIASLNSIHFYLTTKNLNQKDILPELKNIEQKSHLQFAIAKTQTPSLKKMGIFAKSLIINIHFSRPDLETIVKTVNAINICGNPDISKTVVELSRKLGKNCYSESF